MKAKKRNGFWTFCFSFVPGCAEMYWGFMQMGMSLLLPFALLIYLAWLLGMEELMFLDVVVWLYAFFHARNLAHLSEDEVATMPDAPAYPIGEWQMADRLRQMHGAARWVGIALILLGAYKLVEFVYWSIPFDREVNRVFSTILGVFPQCCVAVIAIVVGVRLIVGKKAQIELETGSVGTAMADGADLTQMGGQVDGKE